MKVPPPSFNVLAYAAAILLWVAIVYMAYAIGALLQEWV